MIILDTNVLSALMRRDPEKKIVAWLDRQPRSSIWTTSVTVLEIRFGLTIVSPGKRRQALLQAFDILLSDKIAERVAAFDEAAAEHAAQLMAVRRSKGRPQELRDTMIAGIALSSRATLATRNTTHFNDLSIQVVDPWSDTKRLA